ncbi:TIGR04283 family arsenosugar biosynthesis glycosyltransferase [Paracraurococcus lichenis]|uniref:TIGR04283 family arsenosugar biosynthesis glycosyltransferase n=1 Tax=Paracraurococcus lichenis TaxID=3064888 RepID=A0ABT9E485_9PROT|nr:TIGR04283 family arsenosugar biosynthesis glycosyltransferase [Paracraurococcus sp. LOR1-02]MDO9710983.1 TIGR04283 family arsenosugar biosynthesis glycosyltransferase [Paracraurococcus sp. LOR1-02]
MEQSPTIVIPTLNAAAGLAATLAACAEAGAEILVADAGSTDGTAAIARAAGARLVQAPHGRGMQLAAGAAEARGDWLFFLHADTRPASGWSAAARAFMAGPGNRGRAAHFAFALDDPSPEARRLERLVAWRCRALALPYGDQGLLLSRALYEAVGGFRPIPLMEDVDLVRRLGRRRIVGLPVPAVTSAERWRREGWRRRSARNLACLSLWFLGVPPRLIRKLYA